MSAKNQKTSVDAETIAAPDETGVVDVGDEVWVSPSMRAVLAGDPVIFDMSVGQENDAPEVS